MARCVGGCGPRDMHPSQALRQLADDVLWEDIPGARCAWEVSCAAPDVASSNDADLLEFLSCTPQYNELSTLVHRLQRRTAGLGEAWCDFCRERGLKNPDPHACHPRLLVEFLCESLARAPARVAALKGPFGPFMYVVVRVAEQVARARSEGHRVERTAAPPENAAGIRRLRRPDPAEATFQIYCLDSGLRPPVASADSARKRREPFVEDSATRARAVASDASGHPPQALECPWQDAATPTRDSVLNASTASGSVELHSRSHSSSVTSCDDLSDEEAIVSERHISDVGITQSGGPRLSSAALWLGPERPIARDSLEPVVKQFQ